MAKKPDLPDDEKTLFRDAMRGVKPLTNTKIAPIQTDVKPRVRKIQNTEANEVLPIFSDYETLDPVSSTEILNFARNGLQHKVLRNLRTGQYNVQATLDLHGMTAEEAKHALGLFLVSCLNRGIRHVLIIHGKGRGTGKPVLKNKLNHWLRQTDDVLAFSSAITTDGSTGALYVLLRRK